jgi:hypothetical protein
MHKSESTMCLQISCLLSIVDIFGYAALSVVLLIPCSGLKCPVCFSTSISFAWRPESCIAARTAPGSLSIRISGSSWCNHKAACRSPARRGTSMLPQSIMSIIQRA